MTTPRSKELQALAQRVADAVPVEIAEEVVLTGSVSRGVADDVSDIEMLVVTSDPLELEECFEGAPATLVHGDFRPKNVHLRTIDSGACVFVLDWETAGWGPPAVDLAPARGSFSARHVDIETYVSIAHGSWANLDSQMIGRLVAAGTIFRRLAATDWASSLLGFDVDVSRDVGRLGVYRSEMLEAIQGASL